jgi:flagellar hook assembly protein FlgD
MTNFELAQELVRLGAVTAMGLDSGASTAMAFEGSLLNRPSAGERPIADGLLLSYYGVQVPPPSDDVLSPNGDGIGEKEGLAYKLVRPSKVTATLTRPDGVKRTLDTGDRSPGLYKFTFNGLGSDGKLLPEGGWTWGVAAVDDLGRSSQAERPFSLNTTLKGLTVAPKVAHRGASLQIGVDLVRPARLTVRIESSSAVVLRTLANRAAGTGHASVAWDGRLAGGKRAYAGTYLVRATATNQIGTAELTQPVRVVRK